MCFCYSCAVFTIVVDCFVVCEFSHGSSSIIGDLFAEGAQSNVHTILFTPTLP